MMSSVDLLQRMDVSKITADPLADISSDESIAARSAAELGYNAYQKQLKTEERAFLADLKQLGIIPYTPESVEAYKAKMAKKAGGWWKYSVPQGVRAYLACLIVAAALALVSANELIFTGATTLWWILPTVVLTCAAILFGLKIWDWSSSGWLLVRTKTQWQERNYKGYGGKVPKAVQQIALTAKSVRPDATIFIQELHKTSVGVIDPFLVAKVGDTRFYLAVWNEPSFDGQLLA